MTIKEMREMRENMVAVEQETVARLVSELLKEVETMATKEVKEKIEANPYVEGLSIHIDLEKELYGSRWFLNENMDLIRTLIANQIDVIKEDLLDLEYNVNFEGRKSANKMMIRIKGSARIIF